MVTPEQKTAYGPVSVVPVPYRDLAVMLQGEIGRAHV